MTSELISYVLLLLGIVHTISWIALLNRLLIGLRNSPTLENLDPSLKKQSVTAIIPMRDEEHNVDQCLGSLINQLNVSRLIVVNDHSSDNTIKEVKKHLANQKVELIDSPKLRSGWNGKSNACYAGAINSETEWLLFVDADTRIENEMLGRALTLAEDQKLDAVSAVGELRCVHLWDKISTPFYFRMLNAFYKMSDVNDLSKSLGYFYGNFILIKRESYFKIGGHASIAKEVVEDKEFGSFAKANGLRIGVARAHNSLSAEWVPGFRHGIEALSRVSIPSLKGRLKLGAALTSALTILFFTPWLILFSAFFAPTHIAMALFAIASLAIIIELVFTGYSSSLMNVNLVYSLEFLFPQLVYAYVLWGSVYRLWKGIPISWRGRKYVYNRESYHC